MPALEPDSGDDGDDDAGNGGGQQEWRRDSAREDERQGREIPPPYETTNDSDYIWDGDDDVPVDDEENWGRNQNDKDYNFGAQLHDCAAILERGE